MPSKDKEQIACVVPPEMTRRIDALAEKANLTRANWMRRALLDSLITAELGTSRRQVRIQIVATPDVEILTEKTKK